MIKFINNWFKKILEKSSISAKGTLIYCEHCGSPFTTYSNVHKERLIDGTKVIWDIKCNICNAEGKIFEYWYDKVESK